MFGTATQTWFDATFTAPTEVQRRGWEAIGRREHSLLVAPTGSGKTLAAFLAGIDALGTAAPASAPREPGTRVLYVSPLKALVYDIERNLRAPLAGIRRTAERLDVDWADIRVAVRTGDTPTRERQRQVRDPGDILVTTPESLFLVLGSRARETLRTVHTVIVDEIHALAPTKRGTHLALSLERLTELTGKDPQRIGLSATVRPLDEIARFLGGGRAVEIVDASARPSLDLLVTVPVPDMTTVTVSEEPDTDPPGGPILANLYDREITTPAGERGIWPAIYPRILEQIRRHRSTIVFTNSRGLCERLAQRLNDLAGEELVRAHHGSVSHGKRNEIEESLKAGRLRGIVATSSLELGIDMGAVDRVIQVESPGSVARGLQRVGRAGHAVGEVSVGRLFPKFRGDLLESAVIAEQMREGEIEAIRVPQNVLDVLAQQVVAMCVDGSRSVDQIERLATKAYPFRRLSRAALESVLDMLSGRYPSAEFADLRPLLRWDRGRDLLSARRGAAMVSRMNPGTIPDRGHYAVHLGADGPRIGELDEEMVFETRGGDNILLGASTWRVEEITRDRVVVSPAPGEPGRLPFWKGEGPGRPVEVGRSIGAFLRQLDRVDREQMVERIRGQTPLDAFAAQNLAEYVLQQKDHTGALPTDRTIVVERFRDELGDWRVCILTPFGARLHAPWAMALQRILTARAGFEIQLMYAEDGIVVRFADAEDLPDLEALLPDPDEVEDLVTEQLADTALFAGLFRENAVRSLLLPRRRPTQRNPLWAQRLKAQALMATVRRYPSFPIVLETFRQAMQDVFDLPALAALLRDIRMRNVRVHEVETTSASPFARSLVFAYVAAYMYEQDAPIAERRAQALTLDRNLLSELLGQAELRELIDPAVLAELEEELQHRTPGRLARDADEIHDLLRRLGDLSRSEIVARAEVEEAGVDALLGQLARERRAIEVRLAGELRWISAEDAGLYRDALGVMPPAGVPASFLEVRERPLEQVVRRYARRRGPFLLRDLASRYDLRAAQIEPVVRTLERDGVLVRGEIRPQGSELDLCDAEVLRQLKRRTLARLRREVAPVDARTLGVFLPRWHGVGSAERGAARLLEVLAQLEGLALPWSELAEVILPARVAAFRVDQLDALCASGAVVWQGRGALGARDGRVAVYLREHATELLDPSVGEVVSGDPLHAAIRRVLAGRGASFLTEIQNAVRQEMPVATAEEFEGALWDLVWEGRITNDTFGPLQSLRGRGQGRGRLAPRRTSRVGSPVGGRWWRIDGLVSSGTSDTGRTLARAKLLLHRYGIVSREAASAEDLPGGFSPVYKVLRAMEESGQIRRGHFVEGLTGAQFAAAGAVDRLRAVRPGTNGDDLPTQEDVVLLSAVDPANVYGALLPWPSGELPDGAGPRRVARAWVLLLGGHPVMYVGPGGRQVVLFGFPGRSHDEVLPLVTPALARIPRSSRRGRLVVQRINGRPALKSAHAELFLRCGFERTYRGLVFTGVTREGMAS